MFDNAAGSGASDKIKVYVNGVRETSLSYGNASSYQMQHFYLRWFNSC